MKKLSKKVTSLPVSAALRVDLLAKEMVREGRNVINFCVGEPDFDTPEEASAAGIDAIRAHETKYTNACGMTELRAAIAEKFNIDRFGNGNGSGMSRNEGRVPGENGPGCEAEDLRPYTAENVAVTTGGKYAVYAAVCALTDPGDEIILPAPYWTSYYHIIALAGAVPVVISGKKENGFKVTPEEIRGACTEKTKAVILNNPNNPSGAVYSKKEVEALAAVFCEQDLYVIADEIYDHFLFTGEPFTPLASVNGEMRERTVTIHGVSKAYAMTGWRIGYAVGGKTIIKAISAMLSHTTGCPGAVSQRAAIVALKECDLFSACMCEAFRERRDHLVNGLSGIPELSFPTPEGAFYMMLSPEGNLKEKYPDGEAFSMALLREAGVATVPCEDYGVPGAVRLSFSVSLELLDEGVRRIREFTERNRT